MAVDPEEIPYQVSESDGDLEVWRGEVLLFAFPWHTAAISHDGGLVLVDVISGRVVSRVLAGRWTEVRHQSARRSGGD